MTTKEEQAEASGAIAAVADLSATLSVAARARDAKSLMGLIGKIDAREAVGGASDGIEQAAKNGHLACVKILAARAPSAKAINLAMARAAAKGHADCVHFLLPMADPLFEQSMALRHAAESGWTDCVKILAGKSNVGAMNSYALRWAARMGHAECVELLLEGSDPLAEDCYAIRYAARDGHVDCIKALLSCGHEQARNGVALSWAAQAGHEDCVRILAPCSGPWWESLWGPLKLAAERGRTSCVSALMEAFDRDGQDQGWDAFLGKLQELATMMRREGQIMGTRGPVESAEAMESFVEAASLDSVIPVAGERARRSSL